VVTSPGSAARLVVDLGCKSWPGERNISIDPIIAVFKPTVLYGFDPHPELTEGIYTEGSSTVILARRAAWIVDGSIPYAPNENRSAVEEEGTHRVPCFDFSMWLRTLPACEVIVKMDIEGSEYPIVEKLHEDGTDALISLLLVEWHTGWDAHGHERPRPPSLRCPLEKWSIPRVNPRSR
jgi:hypothetical protein